jgi:hypothetical protein
MTNGHHATDTKKSKATSIEDHDLPKAILQRIIKAAVS